MHIRNLSFCDEDIPNVNSAYFYHKVRCYFGFMCSQWPFYFDLDIDRNIRVVLVVLQNVFGLHKNNSASGQTVLAWDLRMT